jgi:hypothetical protein
LNTLVIGVLRSPLHFIASKGLMVMRWEGKKSGRAFAIPVGYQPAETGVVVMLSKPSEKSWWKNFRSPHPARLCVRGVERSAIGTWLEPGSREFFDRVETTLRRLPWMASQFGNFEYDVNVGLTEEQRAIVIEHVGAVRFEWEN